MTITLTREEAQQVLDALNRSDYLGWQVNIPITKMLRGKLAQPEPAPVAWIYEFGTDNADAVNEIRWYKNVHLTKPTGMVRNVVPLYTAPPQREWVGLTKDEIKFIVQCHTDPWCDTPETDGYGVAESVEKALKEKNI